MKQSRIALLCLIAPAYVGASSAAEPAAAPTAEAENSSPSRQIPDTLMFTIDELNEIRSRVSDGGEEDAGGRSNGSDIENATLYLSTILYYGPNEWTAWINGKPIGPRQDFLSFDVTDIGPSYVELVVPLSAQGMRPVRLSPNQTFISKSGAVVEGKW